MSSRDIRNGILALIILALGIKLILYITGKYVDISAAGEIGKSLENVGDLFIYGAVIIAIILIPFYLSSRSSEKKNSVPQVK